LDQELLLQSRAMQSKALIVGEEQTTKSPNTIDKLMTKFFDGKENLTLFYIIKTNAEEVKIDQSYVGMKMTISLKI
jgi:hypothetical protein